MNLRDQGISLGLFLFALVPLWGYEEYSWKEGLRCEACHESRSDLTLNRRGRDYYRNGLKFPLAEGTVRPKKAEPANSSSPIYSTYRLPVMQSLMLRSKAVLGLVTDRISMGDYELAAQHTGELMSLAGKMEGYLRGERRAAADQARLLKDACFRLERSLRTGEERRLQLVPLELGRVVRSCLTCHASEGLSKEGWSRSPRPFTHRPRPHSESVRMEGSDPSRARDWTGTRR